MYAAHRLPRPPIPTLSLKSICSSVDVYPPYFMAGQKSEKESQSLCCAPLHTELQISVALEAVPKTSPAEFGVWALVCSRQMIASPTRAAERSEEIKTREEEDSFKRTQCVCVTFNYSAHCLSLLSHFLAKNIQYLVLASSQICK